MAETRKILYSPGFGAGWVSWAPEKLRPFMLTHPGLVAAVEAGDTLTEAHPAVVQFLKECHEQFGEIPYLGGLNTLKVKKVAGAVRIDEYDGSESVIVQGEEEGWL